MRLIKRFVIAALFVVLTSPAYAAEIIIAIKEGGEDGFHTDIAAALCTRLSSPCRTLMTETPITDLLQKTVDAATVVEKTSAKNLLYSKRYHKNGARFVRLKGSGGKVSYKSMDGKIVGVKRDTVFARFLSERFAGVVVRPYDDLMTAGDDLKNGTLDFILAGREQKWADADDNIEATGATYTLAKYFGGPAFAFRKEDGKALRKTFNTAIKDLRKSGEYREIYDKHFGDK